MEPLPPTMLGAGVGLAVGANNEEMPETTVPVTAWSKGLLLLAKLLWSVVELRLEVRLATTVE